MRSLSIVVLFLGMGLFLSLSPLLPVASGATWPGNCAAGSVFFMAPGVAYHRAPDVAGNNAARAESGIKENIPTKYQTQYQAWKHAFLITETGRRQWELYENNPRFSLTIVMSDDNPNGASTGKYKWDEAGQLIAATITLDRRQNRGFPNPIYYPVMNSLALFDASYKLNNDVLAAAKLAHEFGHLNYTAKSDATLYQLQTQLTPVYNQTFLSNGRNINDVRLLNLARQMGGTPIEIWENREYWGEANAMLYLRDRFPEKGARCLLFGKIKQSIDLYANNYAERFLQIAHQAPNSCEWH